MEGLTAKVVLSHRAERSVLDGPRRDDLQSFVVAGRPRLATCSGVAWFRGYHLAVVNLYGQHLRIYRFHSGEGAGGDGVPRLQLLHEMTRGLCYPEDVSVSRDGSLLAITHSMSDDLGVTLHRLDAASSAPDSAWTNLRRGTMGAAFHGVHVSPDGRHLAFTQIGNPAYVEVVRLQSSPGERTCVLENRYAPMKPKSVAFSPDGRFIAVPMSLNARQDAQPMAVAAMLSIHRFDPDRGVVDPTPVARYDRADGPLSFPDMCTFLPYPSGPRYRLLISDQALDAVMAFEFDAEERTLDFRGVFVGGLSFPHGVDASADGRFVAVTNYGDDSVFVARVTG
jgi:DNA-binding beta-propeller fold protein YncE